MITTNQKIGVGEVKECAWCHSVFARRKFGRNDKVFCTIRCKGFSYRSRFPMKIKALQASRDRDVKRAYDAAKYIRNRAIVDQAKAGGCVDCGIKDIRVLDFDHVRGEKSFTIASGDHGPSKVVAEIAKCEVRCSNCHRIRTIERGQHSYSIRRLSKRVVRVA